MNESYIYCLHQRAGEIARQVKTALEKEGYEGDAEGLVVDATDEAQRQRSGSSPSGRSSPGCTRKPFQGKIYLPRFCVKEGNGKKAEHRPLDYFEHLVSRVDVGTLRLLENRLVFQG